jgi:hypothetical protein
MARFSTDGAAKSAEKSGKSSAFTRTEILSGKFMTMANKAALSILALAMWAGMGCGIAPENAITPAQRQDAELVSPPPTQYNLITCDKTQGCKTEFCCESTVISTSPRPESAASDVPAISHQGKKEAAVEYRHCRANEASTGGPEKCFDAPSTIPYTFYTCPEKRPGTYLLQDITGEWRCLRFAK